ncbi:MAG: ATP-binding cassette domain-containing protein, partial [Ruminococcaceae bacterium]|nr:ATP-binding cassette domain-containing protein [Oscillospiraceae bacterium]
MTNLFVDIEKRLGNFRLQVKFEAGNEVLALLGASGSGKSMTLKCIAGIEKPDKGKITLDGRVLFDSENHINLSPQKRRVGYLFQQYALFPNMTVEENIAAGVRNKREAPETVREAISAMHLDGTEKRRPHQLSGGQQQRVALARILVNEPDVLLLDEPFSALDSHLRFQLEQELKSVIRQFGKTVLLVSHNRDEVFRLTDSIALMSEGKIETIGDKNYVFANPKTKNGAILTGCKNISAIEKLGDNRVFAKDWGIELCLDTDPGLASHV